MPIAVAQKRANKQIDVYISGCGHVYNNGTKLWVYFMIVTAHTDTYAHGANTREHHTTDDQLDPDAGSMAFSTKTRACTHAHVHTRTRAQTSSTPVI